MADTEILNGPFPVVVDGVTIGGTGTRGGPLHAIGGGVPVSFGAFNGDSVALTPGTPVACGAPSGSVVRADASSTGKSSTLGVIVIGAGPTLPVTVQADGAINLTVAQWNAVTGGSGGLVPGARYYLAASPGMITTLAPTAPGTCFVALGRALSSTVLVLHIMFYVLQ